MHVQLHYTIASQFYVYVNVEFLCTCFLIFIYGGEKRGMLNFFSCVHPILSNVNLTKFRAPYEDMCFGV